MKKGFGLIILGLIFMLVMGCSVPEQDGTVEEDVPVLSDVTVEDAGCAPEMIYEATCPVYSCPYKGYPYAIFKRDLTKRTEIRSATASCTRCCLNYSHKAYFQVWNQLRKCRGCGRESALTKYQQHTKCQ